MKRTIKVTSKQGKLNVIISKPFLGKLSGVVLCLHGGPGGDHHGPDGIFDELADIATKKRFATIQFDMYGAGKSDGLPQDISLRTQLNDYRAMRNFAKKRFSVPLHIAGESMGATIVALDWDKDVASYLLLWPAFDLRDTDLKPYLTDHWTKKIAADKLINDNGTILGAEFHDELMKFDFTPCFSLPQKPCLLVHGRSDRSVPFNQSLRAFSSSCGPSEFHAHPDADHGFKGSVRGFAHAAIKGWLDKQGG